MKREFQEKEEGKWVQTREPNSPVILVDEKNEKDSQRKLKDTVNLNIIFWHVVEEKFKFLCVK